MTTDAIARSGAPQGLPLRGRTVHLRTKSLRGSGGPSAQWVESARVRLLQQRAFRCKQLEELRTRSSAGSGDAAAAEVDAALELAARAALADVDGALRRIERGTYGRCPRCGDTVSMTRLEAVPSAALCGACHRARDTGREGPSPTRAETHGAGDASALPVWGCLTL